MSDFDARIASGHSVTEVDSDSFFLVMESLQAPRQVAATAPRYGVSRTLLLRWRRSFPA